MSKLDKISSILHSDFISKDRTSLQEKGVNMKVSVNSTNCRFLLYKYDKQLKREYKGGLFPFFEKTKNVCSICDYILEFISNNILDI